MATDSPSSVERPRPSPTPAVTPDAEALMQEAYDDLRGLARGYLRRERTGHTLQPTALVHEAYLRLAGQQRAAWRGRSHFVAVGAHVMRRLLVDHARRRGARKRGDGWRRVTLSRAGHFLFGPALGPDDVLALDQALDKLAQLDARQAQVVELRFFSELPMKEIAATLGVSKRTVEGDWTHARAWLLRELRRSRPRG